MLCRLSALALAVVVPMSAADDFEVRELAQYCLPPLVAAGAGPRLLQEAVYNPDPEVRWRCAAALDLAGSYYAGDWEYHGPEDRGSLRLLPGDLGYSRPLVGGPGRRRSLCWSVSRRGSLLLYYAGGGEEEYVPVDPRSCRPGTCLRRLGECLALAPARVHESRQWWGWWATR